MTINKAENLRNINENLIFFCPTRLLRATIFKVFANVFSKNEDFANITGKVKT